MIDWERIDLFTGLDGTQQQAVAAIFSPVRVEAGDFLMREGDRGEEMFILVQGRVRVTKSMLHSGVVLPLLEVDKPRKVLATLGGENHPVLGEMALLDSDVRSASVECLDACELLSTGRQRFFELISADPELGCLLLANLARRLAQTVRRNNTELVKMTTALALALSKS